MRGAVALLLVAGCSSGGFHPIGDGGTGDGGAADMTPLNNCGLSTTMRAIEPLGTASGLSLSAGLAPARDGMAAVWESATGSGFTGTLYFALVHSLGLVDDVLSLGDGASPALLRGSDGLRLFWNLNGTLETAHLDDAGNVSGQKDVTSLSQDVAVAWNGTEYLALLDGTGADMYQVYKQRIAVDGTPVGMPSLLVDQNGGQPNSTLPVIDWSGSDYGVAWIDVRSGTPAIYFKLLDATGAAKTPDTQLSPGGMSVSFASVAAQKTGGWLVCYEVKNQPPAHDIFCDRLDAGGKKTNSAQVTMTATDTISPSLAAVCQYTWLAFADYPSGGTRRDIFYTFLDGAGQPALDQPVDSMIDAWRPHVATRDGVLYATEYHTDNGVAWIAESLVFNCY